MSCPFCHIMHTEETPCAEPARAEPKSWKRERGSNAFGANFPGRCGACGSSISPGDMIKYDEFDELVHEEC